MGKLFNLVRHGLGEKRGEHEGGTRKQAAETSNVAVVVVIC